MTPHTLQRETPFRITSVVTWPTLWRVLVCSAASTTLAVVLMAWQATRFCDEHHRSDRDPPEPAMTWQIWLADWKSFDQIRESNEELCTRVPTMKLESEMGAESMRRFETVCASMRQMRATNTGFYAPATSTSVRYNGSK